MTSQTPPYPYFDGIVYNSSFFTSSSTSGGTVAGSLNYPTAQGIEVFPYGLTSIGLNNTGTITTDALSSGLISSTNNIQATGSITGASFGNTAGTAGIDSSGAITCISLDSTTPTSTFNFLASQKSGFNLGTGISSGQTVQIGPLGSTASVSVRCANIDFTNNSMNNATSAGSGDLSIANNQVSGTLNIGNQTFRTGNINIGTGGLGGTISIGATGSGLNSLVCKGSTGSSISITGPISCSALTATTGNITATAGKLIAGTLDAVSDTTAGTTALKIGSNVVFGDIEIGNAQTTGDIKIGQSDVSGATIIIGTASTATTINGTLTTTAISSGSTLGLTTNSNMSLGATNGTMNITCGGALTLASTNTGAVSIGTSGSSAITIGASGFNTTINGTTIISSVNSIDYSSTSASTNMEIGKSSTTGAIYIGHNQTGAALNIGCGTGAIRSTNADINIGTNGSASSIGNVNIGYAGSSTIAPPTSVQLNGIVKLTGSQFSGVSSGTTGILAGRSGYLTGGTATLDQTVMNSRYFYIVNTATSTITLPASPTTFQMITIKSIVNTTTTIAGNGKNMWITGVIYAASYTLPVYGLITLYYGGTDWYQV